MRVQPFDTLPSYRWPNGRGISRRVAGAPAGATLGGASLVWHASLADIVADGPFSRLPGLDRHFALLTGAATLRCDDPAFEHRVAADTAPFAFQGDWAIDCTVQARPARALNIITRRGQAAAQLTAVQVSEATLLEKAVGETLIAILARGAVRAAGGGGAAALIGSGDGLILDATSRGQITLSPGGFHESTVLLARIGPS